MAETRVYLSLGTNLGEREENLRAARAGLPPAVQPQSVSPIYETPPWGYEQQPNFLNQVVQGVTGLAPLDLLHALKNLEVRLGREATFRYGPRIIDLDILVYGEQIVALPELTIPHPRLAERAFVLVPLADVAPGLVLPGMGGKTIRELLAAVDSRSIRPYPPAEAGRDTP